MKLLGEIKEAVTREKKSNPKFDDSGFVEIDTFFVVEQIVEIKEMFKEIEGRLEGREWTEEEIEILKKYYPVEGIKVMNRLENKTKNAILFKVRQLKIKSLKSWTDEEVKIFKQYYPVEGMKVTNRLNGRTKIAVRTFASKLKLNKENKNKYVYKHGNKYIAKFRVDGKMIQFGTYDTEEEAAKVAMEKAKD